MRFQTEVVRRPWVWLSCAEECRRRWGTGRGVLNGGKKKVFRFPKKARGHSMCSTMVGGSWRLVAAGGWRRLVAGGWWRLVVGGWWRLAVDGSRRLAVGGPLGRSLRAVLSKKKKNLVP